MALTLRAARINAGFKSTSDAALALGVSKNVVANWETCRTYPNVLQLKKIEEVYHVLYNELIFLPQNNA